VKRALIPSLFALGLLASCGSDSTGKEAASTPAASVNVRFTNVTSTAGINFEHHNGRSGKKYLPETLGSGCAFLDYNNDGWPDILLLNSKPWQPSGRAKVTSSLYRNNKDGTFTNVTEEAGLAVEMYAMGVAVADYDNDGDEDIYITALGPDRLFRNEGDGKFWDVTEGSGIRNPAFSTSAAWVDYDRDGRLDLIVGNYVDWTVEGDLWCSLDGNTKSYCTPESYKGVSSRLFHNTGEGRFEDVTEKAKLLNPTSKVLGIALLDFDGDGWIDIFQANDTEPNKLYRNNQDGTFAEAGLAGGVAFAEDGRARGAMGVDAADYDRSGRPHLVIGNFSNEMISLYHNEGRGLFVDEAPTSTVGRDSLLALTFAMFFFDYDLDGYVDIFAANGHLEPEIQQVQPKVSFEQPPMLFRNFGGRRFQTANAEVGEDFSKPLVARGAAYADYDRDGDLDLLVTTNNGPAHLYRNDGGNENAYLCLKLVGRKANRSAIGAVVRVKSASGEQWRMVHSGSSYCSQSQLPLTFGLGFDKKVDAIEVTWPGGNTTTYSNIDSNQFLVVDEEAGIQSN